MPLIPLSIHKTRQTAATVAHWTFDDGSGTSLHDASGNGRTGTLTNGPTFGTNGRLGGALTFDGVNDYVSIADAAALNPTRITVMAWVYLTATGTYPMVCSKLNPTTTGYELGYNDTLRRPEFLIGTGTLGSAISADAVALNEWHWLVGTYDAVNINIYVDAVLKTSTAKTGDIASNTSAVWLGDRPPTSPGNPLTGRMDDVQIRNVAMTADQITAEFQLLTRVSCYA